MAKPKAQKDVNDNIFKIRDTETGLFSNGGCHPSFNKKGKSWSNIGHIKTHLQQFEAIPDTWEIVEIEMRPCSIKPATECFRPPDGRGWGRTKINWNLFPAHQRPKAQVQPAPMPVNGIVISPMNIYQVLQGQPMKGLSFNATIKKNVPIIQLKPIITGKIP